jgi:hypothetical protein
MRAKSKLFGMIGVFSMVMILLAGCAKPPTEKVTALQAALSECEDMGAAAFAPAELQTVTQKMAELNTLMEGKKYGKATQLADSITADIAALKAAVETNGQKAAQQVLASANEQLTALKGLMTEANVKLLGADAAKYQQQCTDLGAKVTALQGAMDSGNVLDVNGGSAVVGELAAAVQACSAQVAQAAEKAVAKKPAKPGKKK